MLDNIKGAIFDMDGTLVDSLMCWEVLWCRAGERYLNNPCFAPSAEDDKAVRTMLLKDAMELIHKNYGMAESGEELLEFTNEMMVDFYTNTVKLKSGTREFLDCLKARGVKMCIASATARDLIDLAMEHCGLNEYFERVISCADVGKGKEEPDVFLAAMDYLGTAAEQTCVFEDSLVALKTAKAAGFRTVGIYDRYNYGQDEIKAIVDRYIAPGEDITRLIKE